MNSRVQKPQSGDDVCSTQETKAFSTSGAVITFRTAGAENKGLRFIYKYDRRSAAKCLNISEIISEFMLKQIGVAHKRRANRDVRPGYRTLAGC